MTAGLVGRRILVVEDEPLISMEVELVLTETGAIVVGPAASVAKALKLVEAEEIDCGVLDYMVEDGTSVPIGEALRARGVPFLLATGYNVDAISQTLPGVPRIDKPYAHAQLFEMLAALLR